MLWVYRSKSTHTCMGSYPSSKYPSTPSTASGQATMEVSIGSSIGNKSQEIIDIDKVEELPSKTKHKGKHQAIQEVYQHPRKWLCEGFLVIFPEGVNHHISYPFGIHSKRSVP